MRAAGMRTCRRRALWSPVAVAHIKTVSEEEAEGPLKQVYDAARARAGGVANIIRVMSQDAATVRSSMMFYVSLMKSPNALSAARRELLATVVSNINDCHY